MTTRIPPVSDQELSVLWRTSNAIAKSRRFKDVSTPEDALARILVGRDLGLTSTDAVTHITFSDGSPVVAAEIQGALLRNFVGPDRERYDFEVLTPAAKRSTECTVRIKRRDGDGKWKSRGSESFSFEDAERLGLADNDFYKRWPSRMLFARALTAAISTYAPETVHPQLERALPAAEILDLTASVPQVFPHGSELEADDPLRAGDVIDRVADPARIKQPQVKMIRELHDYLEHRGELQRFVDTLDVLGVPPGDDLVGRVMQMDENQAAELIVRLNVSGRAVGHFVRDQARRDARERDERRAEREAAAA